MSKQVNVFIGPPGSGKDTQAVWISEEYGAIQVASSALIRQELAENPTDPVVVKEQERYDAGLLNSPEWVTELIIKFVRQHAAQGDGLTFSGSPRTPYEAEMEFPELLALYGERNVRVFHMPLTDEQALGRIAKRLLCKQNKHPYSTDEGLMVCPKDGSPLERRALDAPELQQTRLNEYHTQTEPCLAIATRLGVAIFEIDAMKSPEAIHYDIVGIVERHRMPVTE